MLKDKNLHMKSVEQEQRIVDLYVEAALRLTVAYYEAIERNGTHPVLEDEWEAFINDAEDDHDELFSEAMLRHGESMQQRQQILNARAFLIDAMDKFWDKKMREPIPADGDIPF